MTDAELSSNTTTPVAGEGEEEFHAFVVTITIVDVVPTASLIVVEGLLPPYHNAGVVTIIPDSSVIVMVWRITLGTVMVVIIADVMLDEGITEP